MKIWILTYLPPESNPGGVERFVMNLAAALRSAGHEVDTLAASSEGSIGVKRGGFRPLRAWQLGRKVNRLSSKDDIIICNGYFSWNANRHNSLVVYHGTELGRALATKATTNPLKNLGVRIVNSRLDKKTGKGRYIVAVSNATGEEVERLYGLKVDAVIPNGIDLEIFKPVRSKENLRAELGLPVDRFLVLYLGSTDPRKGFAFLVNELRPYLKPNQELVANVRTSSSLKGLIQVGRIGFDDVHKYYQACDAFIMPSVYEGFSYALAEALACGLPSVVFDTGIGKELLADKILAKYVVRIANANEYLERLKSLEESPEEARLVSEASRRFAEKHFNLRDFNSRYVDLINSLAEKGNTVGASTHR